MFDPTPRDLDAIADALAAGLATAETLLRQEQAVQGLDALDELELHPLLAKALTDVGLACFRETPYPGQPETLPNDTERQRCDLVIAPRGATAIIDLIHQARTAQRAEGTLFAPLGPDVIAPIPPGAVPSRDALWLEVKTLPQYTYVEGVPGPNRGYATQAGVCLTDIRKLANAADIEHAALAIIAFHDTPETATHDLTALMHKCLDKDLPVGGLITRTTPVQDRIGNDTCTVAIIRVRPD